MTKPRIPTPFDKDYVPQLPSLGKPARNGGKGWMTQQALRLKAQKRILEDRHGGAYTRAKK